MKGKDGRNEDNLGMVDAVEVMLRTFDWRWSAELDSFVGRKFCKVRGSIGGH